MKSYIITPQQQDEIKKRDFSVYTFKVGKKKYQCYSVLMRYLLSDSPEMVNRETQQVEIVDKRPILDVYATAFDVGVETFNSDYGVDTSVLYSTNADTYIKTLNDKFDEPYTGWKGASEEFSLYVTPSYIEKIGRASGTRFAYEKLKHNNKSIFEKFEGKGITPPPPSKLTTELNQVRMKAIHQWLKENKYIDVDVDSWLYWFDLQTWNNKKKNPAKIKWIGAVYHLTNVVYLLCGNNMNKQTETAMKEIFQIPKGGKFQKVTKKNIQRDVEPYKSLYSMMKYAERNIKDLN